MTEVAQEASASAKALKLIGTLIGHEYAKPAALRLIDRHVTDYIAEARMLA